MRKWQQISQRTKLSLATFIVLVLALLSLFAGAYDMNGHTNGWQMFFITRIPRTASLLLTGAAMSLCGLVMQLITQNKFVEPTTTGTIEWAGLGLIFAYSIFRDPSIMLRMTFAVLFSFVGTLVFFLILQKNRLKSALVVPLIGIMLGAVISAV